MEVEEIPDLDQETDEVAEEGKARGQPRVRFALEDSAVGEGVQAGGDAVAEGIFNDSDEDPIPMQDLRRASNATVPEPDEEANSNQPHLADQQRMIAANQVLDGVPKEIGALGRQAEHRWQRRHEAPYFAEFFPQEDRLTRRSIQRSRSRTTGCLTAMPTSGRDTMCIGASTCSVHVRQKVVRFL